MLFLVTALGCSVEDLDLCKPVTPGTPVFIDDGETTQ
jgi:hypothetical protein